MIITQNDYKHQNFKVICGLRAPNSDLVDHEKYQMVQSMNCQDNVIIKCPFILKPLELSSWKSLVN